MVEIKTGRKSWYIFCINGCHIELHMAESAKYVIIVPDKGKNWKTFGQMYRETISGVNGNACKYSVPEQTAQ